VTGGQTPEVMPATFDAGAVMVASGFDLSMKDQDDGISAPDIAAIVTRYLESAQRARHKVWPELAAVAHGPKDAWLKAFPHWHPF